MDQLVKRLKRIADQDYKEPDPRTGNYYEKNGETIMEAAATIEALRAKNDRLRGALGWALDEIIRDAVDVSGEEYNKACIALKRGE